MRQFILGVSFSVVFILGCAAGTIQGSQFASAEPAPPGAQRWDIRCFDSESMGVEEDWANEDLNKAGGWNQALKKLGEGGWELVQLMNPSPGATVTAACFKRPLP